MRIVVLHNLPLDERDAADQDVIVQATAVRETLGVLGHDPIVIGCSLDLETLRGRLRETRPDVVFNLVESLGGTDRLAPLVPWLLESLSIPYTGSSARALHDFSNKLITKRILASSSLPVPYWLALASSDGGCLAPTDEAGAASRAGHGAFMPGEFIIKAVWEHASLGLDGDAIGYAHSEQELRDKLAARERSLGRPCFAESFIDGREFNLSLLTTSRRGLPSEPEVLPAAEIDFSSFPSGMRRIVGHSAKWETRSFEYQHTPRRFDFPPHDETLLRRLSELARNCWRLGRFRGHVRVDFRVDRDGRPWILEINVNPCLSPDAGFAAALERAGITLAQALGRVLADPSGDVEMWP